MNLLAQIFGLGQERHGGPAPETEFSALLLRVARCEQALRALELEQLQTHDQVRKWMRRGVAAERNQERAEPATAPVNPATPGRSLTPVARRRLAWRQAEANEAAGADTTTTVAEA
jgi:hypothetical protein